MSFILKHDGNCDGQLNIDGSLTFKETGGDNTNKIIITAPNSIDNDFTLTLPTNVGTANQILSTGSTPGNLQWVTSSGGGGSSSFQNVYDISTPSEFILNSTNNGLIIKDNVTPINDDLFTVSNNSGTLKYLNIDNTGISLTGKINQKIVEDPKIIGTYSTSNYLDNVRGVYVSGQYAYLSTNNGRFVILDILTDPSNPELMSSLSSQGQLTGISVAGNYAITLDENSNKIIIIDVSNPVLPVRISTSPLTGNPGLDDVIGLKRLVIIGSYVYVTGASSGGIGIVDISDPINPVTINTIDDPLLNNAYGIDVNGNYAFVSCNNNRLTAVDITDPLNIVIASSVSDTTNLINAKYINVRGRYAYVSVSGTSKGMTIYDIKDPSSLTTGNFVSRVTESYLDNPLGLILSGNYVYIAADSSDTIARIDITDPYNPFVSGHITSGTINAPRDITVYGNKVYTVCLSSNNLVILDVGGTNLSSSLIGNAEIGKIDITGQSQFIGPALFKSGINVGDNIVSLKGLTGNKITLTGQFPSSFTPSLSATEITDYTLPTSYPISNGYSLTSNSTGVMSWSDVSGGGGSSPVGGINAIQYNNPDGTFKGSQDFTWDESQIKINGSLGLVETSGTGEIVSIIAPENIDTAYTLTLPNNSGNSNELLKTDGSGVLSWGSVELNSHQQLTQVGSIDNSVISSLNSCRNVFVKNGIAYVASTDGGGSVTIINVSDPTNMSEIAIIDGIGSATNVTISGNYAYIITESSVSSSGNKILIYDISYISNPVLISTIVGKFGGSNDFRVPKKIEVHGIYAFVTFENLGLGILDISDPTNPNFISYLSQNVFPSISKCYGLSVSNNKVYITTTDSRLLVIDISDILYPSILGYLEDTLNISGSRAIDVIDNYAYIASHTSNRITIVDVSQPTKLAKKLNDPDMVAATTLPLILNSQFQNGDIVDNVVLSTNDYVLIKDQTDPIENGVYKVNSTGAPSRSTAMNSFSDIPFRKYVTVEGGTINSGKSFVQINKGVTPSTDPISWEEYNIKDFIVGSINDNTNLNSPSDIKVIGNFAFVVCEDGGSVTTIDVSNPSLPIFKQSIGSDANNSLQHSRGMFIDSEYVYVASRSGGVGNSGALTVIDIGKRDITNSNFGILKTNYLNVKTKSSFDGLIVANDSINVKGSIYSNKIGSDYYTGTIKQQSEQIPKILDYKQLTTNYILKGRPDIYNNYIVVVADGLLSDGIIVLYTIKNNTLEKIVESIDSNYDGFKNVKCANGYAYIVSETENSLSIIDLTQPDVIGSIVGVVVDNTNLLGASDLVISGNYAYVCSGGSSDGIITTIDISNKSDPLIIGNNTNIDMKYPTKIELVSETILCISSNDSNSINMVNVSDPKNPIFVANILDIPGDILDNVSDIVVRGDFIYALSRDNDSFCIYEGAHSNSSSGQTLQLVSKFFVDSPVETPLNQPQSLEISGNYAYISAKDDDLQGVISKFDISDPTNIKYVGSIKNTTIFGNSKGMKVCGNYLIHLNFQDYISLIDIGGTEFNSIEAGSVVVDNLQVSRDTYIQKSLQVNGGLNVGSINSTDSISCKSLILKNKGLVTQLTSINTAVTINTSSGIITTVTPSIASQGNSFFIVNNDFCKSDSIILLTLQNFVGSGIANLSAFNVVNGSFRIYIENCHVSNDINTSLIIGFMII